MSILTGSAIKDQLALGNIEIEPLDPNRVRTNSVDLTLGDFVRVYTGVSGIDLETVGTLENSKKVSRRIGSRNYIELDSKKKNETLEFKMDGSGWVVMPGVLYLMHTHERIHTKKFVTQLNGKALALDTPIPTPTGWTTMLDVKVGDWVLGGDGVPVPVIAVTDILHGRPCYSVLVGNNERIIADAEHQWEVQSNADRQAGRPSSIKTTAELAERIWIGKQDKTYNNRIAACRVELPHMERHQFLPVDPYVLGVWLGDGTSANGTVTICHGDEDILEEIKRRGYTVGEAYIKGGSSRYLIDGKPRRHGSDGNFASNDSFHSTLREAGLLGNKHIPSAYLRASAEQRMELLRGLMDMDGSTNELGDRCELTFCDERLARDAYELMSSLGIIVSWEEKPATLNRRVVGTAYRMSFRARRDVYHLHRKARRTKESFTHQSNARPIKEVIPVPSVPVRCIQVGSAQGTYLVGRSFIKTHNSSIARLGVIVHFTAAYGDTGFNGQYTLEVSAMHPVILYPGMAIAQAVFYTCEGEIEDYSLTGHYTGEAAKGAEPSHSYEQFEETR